MALPTSAKRVVIIGGGIFGVSTGLELARKGADVTLVTEGQLASGASGRSLSWLNSAGIRSPEYHRLRMLGLERYREFAARTEGSSSYLRFDGGSMWAVEGDSFLEIFDHETRIGYDARWLAASEVAAVTPGVDPSAIADEGAIFNPGEGWVDLPSLVGVLARQFVQLGGSLITDAGPASVVVEHDRVVGVHTAAGRHDADAVLLATGASVPRMVAEAGVVIPDDSPLALLVWTRPFAGSLRAVLNTPRVAVRPTPGGGLALDSAWSEESIVVGEDGRPAAPAAVIDGLLREASRVLDGKPELELAGYGIGPKPIPGDGDPVFGELVGIDGYFVAFSHSGATLGLVAGELLADEILGSPSPLLSSFRPERFTPAILGAAD